MRARLFAAAMASAVATVAVQPAWAQTPDDPFEKYNRKGFAIQERLDRYVVGPLGYVYRKLTPGPIGKAIHHILVNLSEPTVVINDLLQLRPARAGKATVRFVVNSTVGLGGMIDVAGATGLPHHLSSFGDTLGRYGAKPGPYLFIPMLGPSTIRDLFGNGVDAVTNPFHFIRYPHRGTVWIAVDVVNGLDELSRSMEDLQTLLNQAADPYATLRSAYLQHREAEIRGESAPPANLPDLDSPATPAPQASNDASLVAPTDQSAALDRLPDGKDGNADRQVTSALDEGQGYGDVWRESEHWRQHGIAGFLHPDAHWGDEYGAAHGRYESLQSQDVQSADLDPGHAQREPGAEGAGDPGDQVKAGGQPEAAEPSVQFRDEFAGFGRALDRGWRDGARDAFEEAGAQTLDQHEDNR
jgi:phospholipid-binding lipoprotein MlaA